MPKLNRHTLLASFHNRLLLNGKGDLTNKVGKTLLTSLQFSSYDELFIWLANEALTKDLDWGFDKLAAGSSYTLALPAVVFFLEKRLNKLMIEFFLYNLPTYSAETKNLLALNLPRLYPGLAMLQRRRDKGFQYFRLCEELKD